MVMTDQEYTKHYFIEGERVCSKIGGGFSGAPYSPTATGVSFISGTAKSVSTALKTMLNRNLSCVDYTSRYKFTAKEHDTETNYTDTSTKAFVNLLRKGGQQNISSKTQFSKLFLIVPHAKFRICFAANYYLGNKYR